MPPSKNSEASGPDIVIALTLSPSGSATSTVKTVLSFSSIKNTAGNPTNSGASSTSVTVILTAWATSLFPSEITTLIS